MTRHTAHLIYHFVVEESEDNGNDVTCGKHVIFFFSVGEDNLVSVTKAPALLLFRTANCNWDGNTAGTE